MIMDSLLEFGSINLASPGNLPDVIDTGAASKVVGNELYMVVQTGDASAVGGTSATVSLQTADSTAFSGAVELMSSPAVSSLDLKKDRIVFIGRMPVTGMKRYLRAKVETSGSFSAGSVKVFLVAGPQVNIKGD